VVDWLYNNTASLGLNTYAGVVGVDHCELLKGGGGETFA